MCQVWSVPEALCNGCIELFYLWQREECVVHTPAASTLCLNCPHDTHSLLPNATLLPVERQSFPLCRKLSLEDQIFSNNNNKKSHKYFLYIFLLVAIVNYLFKEGSTQERSDLLTDAEIILNCKMKALWPNSDVPNS